jgi:hypothetical protein
LEPCASTSIPGWLFLHPPLVYLTKGPKYEVQAILDTKFMRNKLYYLVNWFGYRPNDQTWELVENVTNAPQLLEEFYCIYANKSSPCSCVSTRGTRH